MSVDLHVEIPPYLLGRLEATSSKAEYMSLRRRIIRKIGAERASRLRRELEQEQKKGGLDWHDIAVLAMLLGKRPNELYPDHLPLTVQREISLGILPEGWTAPKTTRDGPRYSVSQKMERERMSRIAPELRPLNVVRMLVAYLVRRLDGGDESQHARLEGVSEIIGGPLLAYLNSFSYGEAASFVSRNLLSIKRELSRYQHDGAILAAEEPELAEDWQIFALPRPLPEDLPEPLGDGGSAPPPPGG